MIGVLSRLYRHGRSHRRAEDLPKGIRKRMYRELLYVRDQEHDLAERLDLPVPPRLSVVDEESIAMLRPSDRDLLGLDEMMRRAREEKQEEESRRREERSRRRDQAREGNG